MPAPIQPTRESYLPATKPARIDAEKGVVYGVRVLGPESRSVGTYFTQSRYPSEVMERAKKLYDGAPVNVDMGDLHQRDLSRDIPVTARFGRLTDPRIENGGLHADLHFNPKHPFAEQFLWACENNPSLYGFSHVARVNWRAQPDGTRSAESINHVFSVDIVSDPATTKTAFESGKGQNMDQPTAPDPRQIGATITTPDALTQFLTALLDALPSGTFSDTEKTQVLTQIMTKYDPTEASEPDVTQDATMESLSRRGRLGRAAVKYIRERVAESKRGERVNRAKQLCQSKSLPAHLQTDTFVETVAESIDNTARAEALIADRIATGRAAAAGDPPPADKQPTTGGGGGPKKTLSQLRDEAVAGYSG